jgi:hypothetical protein
MIPITESPKYPPDFRNHDDLDRHCLGAAGKTQKKTHPAGIQQKKHTRQAYNRENTPGRHTAGNNITGKYPAGKKYPASIQQGGITLCGKNLR